MFTVLQPFSTHLVIIVDMIMNTATPFLAQKIMRQPLALSKLYALYACSFHGCQSFSAFFLQSEKAVELSLMEFLAIALMNVLTFKPSK